MPATIKEGSVGTDVATWQEDLKAAGFPVVVSGDFDAETTKQTKAWQKTKGLVADGVVGPASWGAMTGVAAAGKTDKYAKEGRDAMLGVWSQIQSEAAASKYPEVRELGMQPPTAAELQIFGAMAQLESNYGHSGYTNKKTGETSGVIWNVGAIQAGKPPCGPDSFEVTDTGPQGEYNFCYKKYPDQAAGMLDFLRLLTVKRPASWKKAKEGDIDGYSVQMHSWTPPLVSLGQGHGSSVQNLDPITKTPGYFEQPPLTSKGRAYGLEYRVADIAFTLNEPIAAKRGGPVAPGEIVQPPGGTDESGPFDGPFEWDGELVKKVVGAGTLAGIALGAYRVLAGHWPWPGKFPF